MELLVKKLSPGAQLPSRATEGSAGYDLCACLPEPMTIGPGKIGRVPTGIALELPSGVAGFVFGRSGLGGKKGGVPAHGVGVIDWDYRGEVQVGLINHGEEPFVVENGDRIAQLVLLPVLTPELREAEQLSGTGRGSGGFGSTGVKQQ